MKSPSIPACARNPNLSFAVSGASAPRFEDASVGNCRVLGVRSFHRSRAPAAIAPGEASAGKRNLSKWALLALASGLLLAANQARAINLLFNSSFETNSGHAIPAGWSRFEPPTAQQFGTPPLGNFWVEISNATVSAQSGLLYFKEWGASYGAQPTNVAGIYQDRSSAPGSIYQASGWFYTSSGDMLGADCYVWIDVQFLGSSSNLLALYKSDPFSASAGTGTWLQYLTTNACDVSQPVSINDPYFTTYAVTGTVSQLVAPPGTTTARFRFCYAQLNAEGGSCYFDTADLEQVSGHIPPTINSLFPLNMIFVNPADGISFNVNSPSGLTINSNSIGLVLNGANVSSSLYISGTSSNKNVSYHGLQSNSVYTASITVTDSVNLTASASTYFETTWVGVQPVLYLWEAEDFDFNSGMYYNFPILCNTMGMPNCYFGTVGVQTVDENALGVPTSHLYRPNDLVGTVIAGDYARKDHVLAGVYDYRIDPLVQGMWLNYTRNWSNSTYWVIGRLSTDVNLNGLLTLSMVNTDSTTTDLGTFTINGGRGWSTFLNVYLKDTNNNNALVTLGGKQTLRLTSSGNLLPNFFMLVAAQPDLPLLSSMYPTGTHPFEPTNNFSFTVSTFGSSFPTNGIRVNLDGIDLSSNLVFTGSVSTQNVFYSHLLSNATHLAIITVTNALGHGIAVTNQFDTFSESNYMVEAEDFDYGGGLFVTNWIPDAYEDALGPYPAVTNIDFQHITLSGEVFAYRTGGIPQDKLGLNDYLRMNFVGAIDYVLVFFAGTDWANYTRLYPPGSYYVYIRTSGSGPFSMYLDQVVSGAGTTNQLTRRLGRFGGVGKNYNTYAWVPLTDDGLAAPAVVTLNGTATLRLTTAGNCNPNFFMFVPAGGIKLSVNKSGPNTVVAFPTQAGVYYRVFYRTNLSAGNWTLLTTVIGNGAIKSVADPATGAGRFYRVTAP